MIVTKNSVRRTRIDFGERSKRFGQYLGVDKIPFIEFEGSLWYDTGDLGYLNGEGSLFLAGRLKRFVKIAGEMISLPALESALVNRWPNNESGSVLAVDAVETEGQRPDLYLLSSVKIDLDEANEVLRDAGFSNLSKLKHLIELDEIPLLGTGKTDYQTIKESYGSIAENASLHYWKLLCLFI